MGVRVNAVEVSLLMSTGALAGMTPALLAPTQRSGFWLLGMGIAIATLSAVALVCAAVLQQAGGVP